MKIKLPHLLAILTLAILPISACTSLPEATPATGTGSYARTVRDTAITYLIESGNADSPAADVIWQERIITPPGVSGAGGETIEFTSGEWMITISHPLSSLEDIAYDVVVINTETGRRWTGTVEADGSVIEFDPFKQPNKEKSRVIAEEFLRNSPTFIASGIVNTLRLVETKTPFCAFCWIFIYEFDSSHAGYGDNNRQSAQVIIQHQAEIYLQGFKVKSGVLDNKWDMVKQQFIDE